jgi:hypothetical protein
MAHLYNLSYWGGRDQEDCCLLVSVGKNKTLSQKYPTQKRTGGLTKAIQHLPSKHEETFKKNLF